jgi:hypothetical protein
MEHATGAGLRIQQQLPICRVARLLALPFSNIELGDFRLLGLGQLPRRLIGNILGEVGISKRG